METQSCEEVLASIREAWAQSIKVPWYRRWMWWKKPPTFEIGFLKGELPSITEGLERMPMSGFAINLLLESEKANSVPTEPGPMDSLFNLDSPDMSRLFEKMRTFSKKEVNPKD